MHMRLAYNVKIKNQKSKLEDKSINFFIIPKFQKKQKTKYKIQNTKYKIQ